MQLLMQLRNLKLSEIFYRGCVLIYAGLSFYLAYVGKPAELAGFVVAGALALVFLKLDSFKEFSGGGFSAKLAGRVENLERDFAPIRSKETEPVQPAETDDLSPEKLFLDKETQDVLFALTNSKFAWRTLLGVVKDSKLPRDRALEILRALEADGLVTKGRSSSGREIWGATDKGHEVDQLHFPGSGREHA